MNLVTTAPTNDTLMISGAIDRLLLGKFIEIRIRPYPPSLRRIPASTIDPATGASTWALGSHRCVINIGVFTRKAIIVINHHREVIDEFGIKFQKGSVKFI